MRSVLVLALAAAAPAQELRKAITDADVVAVARQVGTKAFSEDVDVHRLQVTFAVRGVAEGATSVAVIDWPNLSLHNRPSPRQTRLYCLHDASREAARIGLPAADGPYYRISGRAGSMPLVGADPRKDPSVRFAQVLSATEAGIEPAATAAQLAEWAVGTDPVVRLEATRHLAEQPLLRARVQPAHWSQLLSRTAGETDDVTYKVALAELCAEQRLPGLVDALVTGLSSVQDATYVRAVGRLTAHALGDGAVTPMLHRLQSTNDAALRAALLSAIGATRTEPALDVLLQLKRTGEPAAAIDAALKEHGSQRARDAVLRDSGPQRPDSPPRK
jgi:hypothetical protein